MVDRRVIDFSTHGRKNPEKLGQILLNGNNVCMVIMGSIEMDSDRLDDSWWRRSI